MTETIKNTYSTMVEYRRIGANALLAVCAVAALSYGLSVYEAISNSMALDRVEAQSASVEGAVRSLDAKYITLSSSITPDAASQYGLAPAADVTYISRTPAPESVAVSRNL